jgi:hypothetical protein
MVDSYRVFYPTTGQYTFLSAAHGAFSKIDHILGHKASVNKLKKIKITPLHLIRSKRNKTRLQQQKKHED